MPHTRKWTVVEIINKAEKDRYENPPLNADGIQVFEKKVCPVKGTCYPYNNPPDLFAGSASSKVNFTLFGANLAQNATYNMNISYTG